MPHNYHHIHNKQGHSQLRLAQPVKRRNVILSTNVQIPRMTCLIFMSQLLIGAPREPTVVWARKIVANSSSLTDLKVEQIVFQEGKKMKSIKINHIINQKIANKVNPKYNGS
jgi:hypothetical protein